MRIHSSLAVPIVALSVLALAACGGSSAGSELATSSPASVSPTTNSAPTTAAPTTAAEPAAADYSPIPLSPSETPAIAKELDFGILNKVTTKNGIITLHVDRATFTLNDSIARWDIKDTDGPKDLTFVLDPKASIQAEGGLQDDQASTDERVTLTLTQFLRNIDTMTVHYQKNSTEPAYPMVWLRHTDGPNGPVTALADQYTP